MKYLLIAAAMLMGFTTADEAVGKNGWINMFDGKTFNGWKVGDNAATFSIENGAIKVHGPKAHLFYMGPDGHADFKDFEFEAKVKTMPGSNSGIYFHTVYQEKSWPDKGFEVQVNNSHTDWKRSGSLYDVKEVAETYVKDNEWYTTYIRVKGKHVIIKLNGKTVLDYTEPEGAVSPEGHPDRLISSGTFALQGHDPRSTVFFKDLKVRKR